MIMPIALASAASLSLTRRRFAQLLTGMGVLAVFEPQIRVCAIPSNTRRLSWLASRNPSAEGAWRLTDIEGAVPKDLVGTLYRIAPGQKENHGIRLRHLFDGDAFVCGYSFRDGQVYLRARFVETPERLAELRAHRMLYREFGTMPPSRGELLQQGGKNQPSVNVIAWDHVLLGLSEGGHPTAIDPVDLSYRGRFDFRGSLPKDVPFTAHPKLDPATGEGHGFGVRQGPEPALMVYRMERDGTLAQLYALPLPGYFMVHDMLMAKEHLVLVIPPVRFELESLLTGQVTPADVLKYFEKEPTRIVILRRDGTGAPVTIERPATMVFHHGNAFEHQGKLVIDSILYPDDTILQTLYAWSKDQLPQPAPARLTRLVLDPLTGKVESRTGLATGPEFPRFDIRRSGEDARYLYTLESDLRDDWGAFNTLNRYDLSQGTSRRVEAGKGHVLGEAVFVPHPGLDREDRGWLLMQGYDAGRDENYLEIRDAESLDMEARIWTGQHFPLGFHGNFIPTSFVSA
jgi:all-trans-8'-apo-beta-carotenal 15,15'-oxygenase